MNGGGVWKWVAGILAALMVGGSVTLYQSLSAPNKDKVDRIEERQQIVLQRLATIEARLFSHDTDLTKLSQDIAELEDLLRSHILEVRPR